MKQIQLVYNSPEKFRSEIQALRSEYADCTAVIHIFYDKERTDDLNIMTDILDNDYPEALYLGCTSNSNIEHGMLTEGTIEAVCCFFQDSTSKFKILQYPLSDENREQVCDSLLNEVSQNKWVKGIELLITIRDMSTTYFCDRLSEMDENIQIFGGSAFNKNLDRFDVGVFSKGCGFMESGVVFLLMGGENLNIWTTYISGWKPLGQKLRITKAEANRLYELNGEPAYETYYRYLQIDNDEFFYYNTLEFPLAYERGGTDILRVPSACMEDGSLIMTSDMTEGSQAQISYGDPQTILKSILQKAEELADFVPDGIIIFDCASRRSFWGTEDINRESLPFQTLADTAGFYTAGEYHRLGRSLNQHNVTLVIVGIREGGLGSSNKAELLSKYNYNNEHVSMIRRLANFIDVASGELEDTNRQLEHANEQLTKMALTDGLTGLLNRRTIQDIITQQADTGNKFSLIMLDLDYFKSVNDTYGHDEGDTVLKRFAKVLTDETEKISADLSIGRWGGEEFMIFVPNFSADEAFSLAENIRITYADIDFSRSGKHTVSCGVTENIQGETADDTAKRVDSALYRSKESGRNRTVKA